MLFAPPRNGLHKTTNRNSVLQINLIVKLFLSLVASQTYAQTPTVGTDRQLNLNSNLPAVAETTLTLQKAIELALSRSFEITLAKQEIQIARAQIVQSQTRPNPELAYYVEDQKRQTQTQSIQINVPIEIGGKRQARISSAESAHAIAVEELNMRFIEVRAKTTFAFFETLVAQERVRLAQDSAALAQQTSDAVAKRVAAGKVSPVEEIKAKVAQATARIDLTFAQSDLRTTRAALVSVLGVEPPRFEQVTGNLELNCSVPSIAVIRRLLTESPTHKRAQLEIERRKSLIEIERSKRTPDVTVSLGMKRASEVQRNQLLLGISVPLPLFDRNQGNLQEALTRADKTRDEYQAQTVRSETDVLQARERLESICLETDLLRREILPAAKSAYDAATIGFEHGKFNFLEVLDAQRSYFSVKSQYLKALLQGHRAAADIDRVISVSPLTLTNDK